MYAALAYYFDHRDAIDQDIEASNAFAEALRQRGVDILTLFVVAFSFVGDGLCDVLEPQEMSN